MSASASVAAIPTPREPELLNQTLVVIGGSAGIGLETARRARVEGASIILTARNTQRLEQAERELGAERTAAFDASDADSLQSFFEDLPSPIDHVMVTADAPHYGRPLEISPEEARQGLTEHLLFALNESVLGQGPTKSAIVCLTLRVIRRLPVFRPCGCALRAGV
jgi:NAD(P)-dependent dehydrogenase (short-subunit alcohol dehydrogenase family)